MVTFVSLFLWLVTGVHPVEVSVGAEVATVEIVLDGETVGVLDGPPWTLDCDFGSTLRPHELIAVARGADGTELDRAVQYVNLPRPKAEIRVVFDFGPEGRPAAVRVVAESGERLTPLSSSVSFDGQVLTRSADGRFPLPAHDPRENHIVTAEARFPGGVTARRDVTYSGARGGRVATELTAVAVVSEGNERPPVNRLQGLFRVRGEVVRVAAMERPGARVYLVRDQDAWSTLFRLGLRSDQRSPAHARRAYRELESVSIDPSSAANLPPDRDRFRLVIAHPTYSRGLALFPVGQPLEIKRWGLPWLATHITGNQTPPRNQRLGEAVAAAALGAAAEGSPRVVILVLPAEPEDFGAYGAEAVRAYVRSLHVPLVVWSLAPDASGGPWGEAEDISDLAKLGRASRGVMKALDRQWIVWIEGRHLPSDVELAANRLGLRLAD